MKKQTLFKFKDLYEIADYVLNIMNNLPDVVLGTDFVIPDTYKPERNWGVLDVVLNGVRKYAYIGEVKEIKDPEYGLKQLKYRDYAQRKNDACLKENKISSKQTTFAIAGALVVDFEKTTSFGFSGFNPDEDQLYSVLLALIYKNKQLMKELKKDNSNLNELSDKFHDYVIELLSLLQKDENPYLIFDLISYVASYHNSMFELGG